MPAPPTWAHSRGHTHKESGAHPRCYRQCSPPPLPNSAMEEMGEEKKENLFSSPPFFRRNGTQCIPPPPSRKTGRQKPRHKETFFSLLLPVVNGPFFLFLPCMHVNGHISVRTVLLPDDRSSRSNLSLPLLPFPFCPVKKGGKIPPLSLSATVSFFCARHFFPTFSSLGNRFVVRCTTYTGGKAACDPGEKTFLSVEDGSNLDPLGRMIDGHAPFRSSLTHIQVFFGGEGEK